MDIKSFVIGAARRMLPARIKRALFNFAARVDPESAVEHAFGNLLAPDMELGLRGAKARGLVCQSVLDIGAYEGDWTRMARRIWPDASLTMVEANDDKLAKLNTVAEETGAGLHMALLGPTDGEDLTFHVMEAGSSVLEENSPLERSSQTVVARSLDALFEGETFDLIKIDVQGFELNVMRGGEALLSRASAVILEIALMEINQGAPLIDTVLSFMRDRGFVAYEVLELHRRPLDRAMNQLDFLFVREDSTLRANKTHF